MPVEFICWVVAALIEVPLGLVPCQCQTSPEGGVPEMVAVFGPHACVLRTILAVGAKGSRLTVTETEEAITLQQPVAVVWARR